mgnify:CR=1 FL=1
MNGLKHGDGIWRGKDGDSYAGEWKDNKPDGSGLHLWKNGDKYEGEWYQSLKQGQGSDMFANGDVYAENGMGASGRATGS